MVQHWSSSSSASTMMTSSNENIFRVTGPLCGEFTSLNKRLSNKIHSCLGLIHTTPVTHRGTTVGFTVELQKPNPSSSIWMVINHKGVLLGWCHFSSHTVEPPSCIVCKILPAWSCWTLNKNKHYTMDFKAYAPELFVKWVLEKSYTPGATQ